MLQVEHMGHMTVILSEAVMEHKMSLTNLVSKVRQMSPEVERAIQEVENTRKQLLANTEATKLKVSERFHCLQQFLYLWPTRHKSFLDDREILSYDAAN